jgi:hypothetical protein
VTVLTFFPWVSAGAAAGLSRDVQSDNQNRPLVKVQTIASSSGSGRTAASVAELRMLGPGDVVGIDSTQVVRTEPHDGATGVETTLFPSVDLDAPFLPWLFTGQAPRGRRVPPWLCLVVVPDKPGVLFDASTMRLRIGDPADAAEELPNLQDWWAWAHAQYSGALQATVSAATEALSAQGARLSRLVCARVLEPNTRYLACVVPTTSVGRVAGLGGAPKEADEIQPAWTFPAPPAPPQSAELPVYFHFSFSTGEEGDFESLARALAHPPDIEVGGPDGLGQRVLVVTRPGGDPVGLTWSGALRPIPEPGVPVGDTELPDEVRSWLRDQCVPVPGAPELRPPMYGAVQAGLRVADLAQDSPPPPPGWLEQLAMDPRLRATAAFGARIVVAEREDLTGAAFRQVEGIREVNSRLSRGQMARAAGGRLAARHLAGLDDLGALQVSGPHASRMAVSSPAGPAGMSVWGAIRIGSDPRLATATSAAYRRITRPRGPHARATRARNPAPPPPPRGMVRADQVRASLGADGNVGHRVRSEWLSATTSDLAAARQDELRELAPRVRFGAPMVRPLYRLAPHALLPGVDQIPRNTALLVEENLDAIAAYMAGLNHELERLLQWRQVPTDRTATPFANFWAAGSDDVRPMDEWSSDSPAVDPLTGAFRRPPRTVLVVRGDLFRRYPRTAVYAVAAQVTEPRFVLDVGSVIERPAFFAALPPDLYLLGFGDVSPQDLVGDPADPTGKPGYFIVFQEQVSETRFGTDPLDRDQGLGPKRPASGGTHWTVADIAAALEDPTATTDAATLADAVRMPPALVAIHARLLLPRVEG